ncbi:MAG: EAL domain-containing protein, partial [Rhodanobacteraceae bacterium]
AVNLSPLQLKQSRLVLQIQNILHDSGLRPDRLDLEITESALLVENAATRLALNELRNLGIGISLDDFGTGYSSLRSLRAFPVDKIKIDRSFVAEIGRNGDSDAIIRAVIGLARDLGIATAAEGIENQAQLRWLTALGCTQGQGHYFSVPMSEAQTRILLESDLEAGAKAPRVRRGST